MKFYDTSALLDLGTAVLVEPFLIADMTLYELEDIKTSGKKDESTKAKARAVTRMLAENPMTYTVIILDPTIELSILEAYPIKNNNDGSIMAAARSYLDNLQKELNKTEEEVSDIKSLVTIEDYRKQKAEVDSFQFVTSDLSCLNLAQQVMKLPTEYTFPDAAHTADDYKGWMEVALDEGGADVMAMAYSKDVEQKNLFDTPTNGYVLIPNADADGNTVGLRWDGSRWNPLRYKNLNTAYSGKIKPLNSQQKLAFDLLQDQDITIKLLLGVYGSGKDFLMINHALDLIEKGKYDKIVWVRNNVEVKNSKPIGFLPGDPNAKILPFAGPLFDNLGGEVGLERAIADGIVELQHLGFMRGRSWDRSIIYSSEAENLTKEHIQLLIGRVGKDSALWLNGDLRQIDEPVFEHNSGIAKVVERLVGQERFGMVYLPTTERSETARMADLLD